MSDPYEAIPDLDLPTDEELEKTNPEPADVGLPMGFRLFAGTRVNIFGHHFGNEPGETVECHVLYDHRVVSPTECIMVTWNHGTSRNCYRPSQIRIIR